MPIKEFTCNDCEHQHEDLVGINVHEAPCPECGGNSRQVHRTAPKIDWGAMGAQENVSPEFIDRFERTHKKQLETEQKAAMSNGSLD